jgi:hypothetical protein
MPTKQPNDKDKQEVDLRKRFLNPLRILSGLLGGLSGGLGAVYGTRVFNYLVHTVGPYSTKVFISGLVIAAGVGAYWFKRQNAYLYGLTEVVFGSSATIAVTFRISPNQSMLAQWITLIGCAYVIARGLSNMASAQTKNT